MKTRDVLAVVLAGEVYESILMEGVQVGRRARIRRAIIDKNVVVPPGMVIGYDLDEDRKRFPVSEKGIVVIPKGTILSPVTVMVARAKKERFAEELAATFS
ncbi:MAG: hypothetical protein JSV16_02115 [Candidatus Hydrogenedentota bacterium]|nr:MAG: hypothetical protein JSV16_02115 [Candidatus Hydrogenedentota bacterium]